MAKNLTKNVLVAPLDWGLGHATRCIPIIRALEKLNHKVVIASGSSALTLLRKEFPNLPFEHLSEYNPSYGSSGNFMFAMIRQSPKLLLTIIKEHHQIKNLIAKYKIDLLISDNRYGVYSPNVPSIFITHQTNIRLSQNLKFMERPVNLLNQHFIGKHNECWIPDVNGDKKLSGNLSVSTLERKRFIGPLSRFYADRRPEEIKYSLLILLSGQEPQRTQLESTILKQFESLPEKTILVRGTDKDFTGQTYPNGIDIKNMVSSDELENLILSSDRIISRAGYSSIMDYVRLGKKAILIPTPGQTEQEYLAKHLHTLGYFYSIEEDKLDLRSAMSESEKYIPPTVRSNEESLSDEINRVINEYCL